MNFSALSHWIKTVRKAGLLNPGEALPAMVEVALPPSMLAQALKALLRQ